MIPRSVAKIALQCYPHNTAQCKFLHRAVQKFALRKPLKIGLKPAWNKAFLRFRKNRFLLCIYYVGVRTSEAPCGVRGGGAPPPPASGPGQPTRTQAEGLCTALRVRGLPTP